jgi:hypothetical protein
MLRSMLRDGLNRAPGDAERFGAATEGVEAAFADFGAP